MYCFMSNLPKPYMQLLFFKLLLNVNYFDRKYKNHKSAAIISFRDFIFDKRIETFLFAYLRVNDTSYNT